MTTLVSESTSHCDICHRDIQENEHEKRCCECDAIMHERCCTDNTFDFNKDNHCGYFCHKCGIVYCVNCVGKNLIHGAGETVFTENLYCRKCYREGRNE